MEVTLTREGFGAADQMLSTGPLTAGRRTGEALRKIGIGLQNYIQVEELNGQMLGRRTGRGQRSIFYRLRDVENAGALEMAVVVGANLGSAVYMRAQEQGATITPKNGQYLTVPLAAALTGNRVARFTAAQVRDNPEAFGYTSTFVAKHIIFGTLPHSGHGPAQIVPLFKLVTSVTIRPVGYLDRAARDKADWIAQQFDHAATLAVQDMQNGGGQ